MLKDLFRAMGEMFSSRVYMICAILNYKGNDYTVTFKVKVTGDLPRYVDIYRIEDLRSNSREVRDELESLLKDRLPFRCEDENLNEYLKSHDIKLIHITDRE